VRVLFSSTWGVGHVFPMVPLARAFVDAGHTVLWATPETAGPLITAAGLDVVPVGLDPDGVVDVRKRLAVGLAGLSPEDRASFAFPNMFGAWATPCTVKDLLPLARDWRPDLMIHENAELPAPLVGALLGVPVVTHSFGGAVPTPFLMDAGNRLASLWAEHDLQIPPYAGAFTSGYIDICPSAVQTQSLDHIPVRHPIRPIAYAGEGDGPLPALLQGEHATPLVYLTMGTVQNKSPDMAAALQGVSGLGARILVTVGFDGDPDALGPQPEHVGVERWVRQTDVLPLCTAVVSHAGSGTFLGALSHGLPQLCLPQAADQFRNSKAAAKTGCGLVLQPDEITPEAVTTAVGRILNEDSFGRAANGLADDIRDMPAPSDVVTSLERDVTNATRGWS
jgi:UDP:flavonoid glycosyltransferase YjiC (YdhE family)